jgi:hypothetical protein
MAGTRVCFSCDFALHYSSHSQTECEAMATSTSFSRMEEGNESPPRDDPTTRPPGHASFSGSVSKDVPTDLTYKRDAFIRELDWSHDQRAHIEELLERRRKKGLSCAITTTIVLAIVYTLIAVLRNPNLEFTICIFGFMLIWCAALQTRSPDQQLQRQMMIFYREKYNVDPRHWDELDSPSP